MKYLTGNQIRKMWLDFFKSKGHHIEKGASLIPYNDPTLLWINSGVAALKRYMDGSEVPPSRRITNVQKSIRTNDMDNVGYTARHHTFFEMLGCFSIGDYFRDEIIQWAFEILTSANYFSLDKDKLYFTYNPSDIKSYELWKKQGVQEDHLIPLEGNYWQIGEGPCGPNTEVFYDRGDKYDPNHIGIKLLKEDMENDRYVEIWGIVLTQFNAVNGVERKDYEELPSKNIDTGAGLERIASILQEAPTNFETDLFMPIIKNTAVYAKYEYKGEHLISYRVIADHIRAVTFALNDGERFSNEGRGYVLRRLIRRAMRFGKKLGIRTEFLCYLVPSVIETYKDFYPELSKNANEISSMIKIEEDKFLKTLSTGEVILKDLIKNATILSGADAFKLYDTFGFPIDLTVEICKENNIKVDIDSFNNEMAIQKDRARNARQSETSMNKQSKDLLEFTNESIYCGNSLPIESVVIGLFKNGVRVSEIIDEGDIIFAKSNFYAESGGQVGDTGRIFNDLTSCEICNVTKAPNKQHLHRVKISKGSIKEGDSFSLVVNHQRHEFIKRNHTATHLLQSGLVKVLGEGIKQMGSFVGEEYLRFDFSYSKKISDIEIKAIENFVNKEIANSLDLDIKVLEIEKAQKLGAKAFFSEKYGDFVRVVTLGDVSMEFCGGSHVSNTSEIGLFKIEFEESIASGVRRIQGRTSYNAYQLVHEREMILDNVKNSVSAKSIHEINDRLKSIINEKDLLKKRNDLLDDKISANVANSLRKNIIDINGYQILTAQLADYKIHGLMKVLDVLKSNLKDYIIVLFGTSYDGVSITVSIGGKPLEAGNHAGLIVKGITNIIGGSGGGKNSSANGMGKDKNLIDDAINDLIKNIK